MRRRDVVGVPAVAFQGRPASVLQVESSSSPAKKVQQHPLVIAHQEDAPMRQREQPIHDLAGLRTAVDVVADEDHLVLRTRGDLRQQSIQGPRQPWMSPMT